MIAKTQVTVTLELPATDDDRHNIALYISELGTRFAMRAHTAKTPAVGSEIFDMHHFGVSGIVTICHGATE